MFKKSFIAVMSALAITATGMASTASAAFSDTANDNYAISYSANSNSLGNFDYSQSSLNKIRKIPQRLAAKWAGINVTGTYEPSINSAADYNAYQTAMNKITGNHTGISYWDAKNKGFCYSQSDTTASYATANATSACPTYALATALSIYTGVAHTPKSIHPNGTGLVWTEHDALAVTKGVNYCSNLTESEILLAIDAQLAMGRPAIIHLYKNENIQHWATVIGKDNSKSDKGEKYTIIDPWDGSKRLLKEMTYYNSGTAINGYAIISDELS